MRIISAITFFFVLFSASAQEDFVVVDNIDQINKTIQENTQKVFSIKSDFTQHKNLSMLEETLISKGSFLFKKEDNVRWQYTSPFEYTIVVSNGKFQINNEGSISEFDMNSNEMFSQINNMIVTAISGDFIDNEDFTVIFKENNNFYLAELSPTEQYVAEMLKSINIYFHKEFFSVEKVKFVEAGDDYTLIIFENRQENIQINDDEFLVK